MEIKNNIETKTDKLQMQFDMKITLLDEEDLRRKSVMEVEFHHFRGRAYYSIKKLKINEKYGFDFESSKLTDFQKLVDRYMWVIVRTVNRYQYAEAGKIADETLYWIKYYIDIAELDVLTHKSCLKVELLKYEAWDGDYNLLL